MTPSMLVSQIEHILFHKVSTVASHTVAIAAVEAYTAQQAQRIEELEARLECAESCLAENIAQRNDADGRANRAEAERDALRAALAWLVGGYTATQSDKAGSKKFSVYLQRAEAMIAMLEAETDDVRADALIRAHRESEGR